MSRRVYDEGTEVWVGDNRYRVDYYKADGLYGPLYGLIKTPDWDHRGPVEFPTAVVHHLTHEDRLLRLERALGLDDE